MAKSKINILDKNALRDCTGCTGCSLVCPSNAISINIDRNGFFRPSIEMVLCTMCGECTDVCYKFNEFDCNNPFKDAGVVAVTNNYIDDMNLVTTVGVASRLAEYFYEKGYGICGVRYDYVADAAKHDIAHSLGDILEYRGSKYMPSDAKMAFEMILLEKKKSIIFGLPCQIHGFRKVIEKKKIADKFILIDFFCAGILSKNLWDKYLDYLRRRFSVSKIKQLNFKDKTEGWRKSSLYVLDECGVKYRQNRFNDIFYAFLLRRVPYQEACYSCSFRRNVVSSDIRLGDFWGPKYKKWDDGVELMTLMSDKGEYAWNEIKDYFSYQICKEDDIYESQDSGAMNIQIEKPENYDQVLAALSSGQIIEEIFKDLKIAKIPIVN